MWLHRVLPDRPTRVRIWRGPFRGARIVMNPRHSLRKIFGLYEHELNEWIELALKRVSRVIDVGANDGYFTFGCRAAFARQKKHGAVIAFEPQARHADDLRASASVERNDSVEIEVIESLVGRDKGPNQVTLDCLEGSFGSTRPRDNTLIKIDVEGAEMDVVAGATSWMRPTNLFLIEVHDCRFVSPLVEAFGRHGLSLRHITQRPLPILGKESRDPNNSWLVSALSS